MLWSLDGNEQNEPTFNNSEAGSLLNAIKYQVFKPNIFVHYYSTLNKQSNSWVISLL